MESTCLQSYLTPVNTAGESLVPAAHLTEKKSRFLAYLAHVETAEEAAAHLERLRERHYDARHHVHAYILADGSAHASDDGEPSRTAGAPVLDVLNGLGIADVSAVVVRYFGGTLLGTGGLIRAYSQSARLGIEALRAQEALLRMQRVQILTLTVPYALFGAVSHLCDKCGGRIVHAEYSQTVTITCSFKVGKENSFIVSAQNLLKEKDLICCKDIRYEAVKDFEVPGA